MSDDASYLSFLNKANADLKSSSFESPSTSQSKSKYDPTSTNNPSNDSLPPSLQSLPDTLTYTSDTDSPFEPVFLNYTGDKLPSLSEFRKVLAGNFSDSGAVEELSVEDFDPRRQYREIIDRVEQAGSRKGVKVFRVEISTTRVEYYIVTIGDGKLIGLFTKAVES